MGILGFMNSIGNFAGRFVSKSGWIGKIATGVKKAADLVGKYVPKIMPVVKTVGNFVKTGINTLHRTGILDKVGGGKVTNFFRKVGVINTTAPTVNTTANDSTSKDKVM